MKYYQNKVEVREEIKLLSEALGKPEINLRENAKYRWHMEDAAQKLQT